MNYSFKDALAELEQEIQIAADSGYPLYDDPYTKAIQAALEIAAEQSEKDRVLELMAEAVSKILQKFDKDHSDSAWWYTTSDEVGLLEEAISEYKKLKGGACRQAVWSLLV